MRRLVMLGVVLSVATLGTAGAQAAVQKFRINTINITESPTSTPIVDKQGADEAPSAPFDTVFVDDGIPGSPVLKKFRFKSLSSTTVNVPGFASGSFIFLNNNFLEGPGTTAVKPTTFTGTGHTAAGSTLAWGIVTGWSITGAQFCHASPPVVCDLAGLRPDTTNDPAFHSDFYDMGTWFMHPTGFTATPFVHQYFTGPPGNFGNNQRWIRGFFLIDATVPALPLVGVALLGGSLVVGGLTALRRRRK